MIFQVYLMIGAAFATITFVKGGKVSDEPVPFLKWLIGYVLCILSWPAGILILIYLASECD